MGPVFANLLEIGGEGTHEKRPDIESQTVSSILLTRSEVWRPKPFMPHFDITYIISKHGKELNNSLPCLHL